MIEYLVACEYYNLNPSLEDINSESKDKLKIKLKHPRAFINYCKQQGYDEVNCECICKALKAKSILIKKRANFARNFSHKECKCDDV